MERPSRTPGLRGASRLLAVTKDDSGTVLHVLPRPFDPVTCTTDLQAGNATAASAHTLRGTVVDGAGAPADGAVVVLRRTDPLGQVKERGRTTSDVNGRFSFEDTPDAPGRHRYQVEAKAYGRSPTCSATADAEVAAASPTTTSTTTTTPAASTSTPPTSAAPTAAATTTTTTRTAKRTAPVQRFPGSISKPPRFGGKPRQRGIESIAASCAIRA